MSEINLYLNKKQTSFYLAAQPIKVFIGGRGTGKTTVGAAEIYKFISNMPRSKGYLLGRSLPEIQGGQLPSILAFWENELGLKEKVHYVKYIKPPKKWKKPRYPHDDYTKTISFCNGTCLVLMSFHKKDGVRGGNYDWGVHDEVALISEARYKAEVLPLIRGNKEVFAHCKYHQSRVFLTTMPWTPDGQWILKYKELAKTHKKDYYYIESTSWDNVDIIGKKVLQSWKAEMDFATYETEVMNKPIVRVGNCFYATLSEDRHIYALEAYKSDYDKTATLALSFDFGGSICCATAHQAVSIEQGESVVTEDRTIRAFARTHAKDGHRLEDLLTQLVKDIIKQYPDHKSTIELWGDRNGNNRVANSTKTFFEQIEDMLKQKGFTVKPMITGLDLQHQVKYRIINDLLAEQKENLPQIRINRDAAKSAIISMQLAPVGDDFKKDKSSERKAGDQEKATHLSDCIDNYYAKKYKHLYGGSKNVATLPTSIK